MANIIKSLHWSLICYQVLLAEGSKQGRLAQDGTCDVNKLGPHIPIAESGVGDCRSPIQQQAQDLPDCLQKLRINFIDDTPRLVRFSLVLLYVYINYYISVGTGHGQIRGTGSTNPGRTS